MFSDKITLLNGSLIYIGVNTVMDTTAANKTKNDTIQERNIFCYIVIYNQPLLSVGRWKTRQYGKNFRKILVHIYILIMKPRNH